MDKPSGDAQLLEAARDCLDKGDYVCAQTDYQAISNAYADVKTSESSLTTLASNDIFFMADLFKSLGSGKGDATSIVSLAITLAGRSAGTAGNFAIIQATYAADATIADPTLKSFSQLISSMAMFSAILSSATTSGTLTSANLVANPATCLAAGNAGAAAAAGCAAGTGTGLKANAADAGDPDDATVDMSASALWNSAPSLNKLNAAASALNTAIGGLTQGGGTGILGAFGAITGLGGVPAANGAPKTAAERVNREIVLSVLFPNG